jgi:hypothetical protein
VYTAGMGLVDQGGDHVHVIRNDGSVEARTMAVQVIPAGATRRIDAAANAASRFEIAIGNSLEGSSCTQFSGECSYAREP